MKCILLVCYTVLIANLGNLSLWGQTIEVNHEIKQISNRVLLGEVNNEIQLQALIDSTGYYEKSNSDSGLLLYFHIAQQCRRLQYHKGTAFALVITGNIYINKGRYREALNSFKDALKVCLEHKDSLGIYLSLVYNNVGNAYRALGDIENAFSFYLKALNVVEIIPGSVFPQEKIYLNMSGRLQDAAQKLYYLNKADSIARSANNYGVLAMVLLNKSFVYNNQKRYWESDRVLWDALRIGKKVRDTLIQHRVLVRLAANKNYQAQPDSALLLLHMAEKRNPAGEPDVFQRNADYLTWSTAYLRLKRYDKAIEYADSALHNALKLELAEQVAYAHGLLAEIYASYGRFEKAYKHHTLFKAIKDSIMNSQVANNISNLEAKYQSVRKDKALAESRLLIQQKNRTVTLLSAISITLLLLALLAFRNFRNRQRLLLQRQENQQLRAVIQGEEQERSRLARELHDGVGGMLVAISMKLNTAKKEVATPLLAEMDTMLRDAGTEVRNTAHNLMPDVLDRHTLKEALQLFCTRINASGITHVGIQCHNIDDITDKTLTLSLYRIVQELVQNILRHADARNAEIQLMRYGQLLTLTVEDDGKGFDVKAQNDGLGLHNVRRRVQMLQGVLSISSQRNKGTTVYIEFDLDKL